MNEKEKRIIEVSMKLFAEKGYHATSIQEIAKQSNVSKGAFYLHFDSKSDLVMASFQYYSELVLECLEQVNDQGLEPKQKLQAQIKLFLDMLSEHKEYIIMHFRDNLQLGDQFNEIVIKINEQGFKWMSGNLRKIYGKEIEPYIIDATIQFEGVLSSYFKWLVMHELQMDKAELAAFIVRRVDHLVQGMIADKETPQIKPEQINYRGLKGMNQTTDQEKVMRILNHMLAKLEHMQLTLEQREELQEAAELIKAELEKKEPKKVIIQGMLTHFLAVPELYHDCMELAERLGVQLLTRD